MRSPPADVFIYGVHPATAIEDIIADLAESGVEIDSANINLMSKAEANLKSFKISVKAEDLQKALDPAIWPMRVKVREFIHYRRNPGADNQGGQFRHRGQQQREKQPTQQHPSTGHVASGDSGHHGQNNNPGQGQHSQGYAPLAPNRYAMPGDNVPGGGLLQV